MNKASTPRTTTPRPTPTPTPILPECERPDPEPLASFCEVAPNVAAEPPFDEAVREDVFIAVFALVLRSVVSFEVVDIEDEDAAFVVLDFASDIVLVDDGLEDFVDFLGCTVLAVVVEDVWAFV